MRIVECRKRYRDADGGFAKYVVDALVSAGVLGDDTPAWLPQSPSIRQVKSPDEGTLIELWRC